MTSVIGYITLYSVFVGTTGFVWFLYKIKKKLPLISKTRGNCYELKLVVKNQGLIIFFLSKSSFSFLIPVVENDKLLYIQ